jgi:large repetitive protein
VRAVDPVGNVGTASFSFSVNSTAPTVTLMTVPAHLSNNTTAAVAFSVDDLSATAWCSLDGGPAAVCTSPISYPGLADGPHTIAIYAVSAAALTGSTITTGFSVDTVAPVVSVPAPLTGSVRSVNATLAFTANDPTATIYCAIDAAPAAACASPLDLSALAEGAHTVSVYARDPAGNQSSTVQDHFTIDNTAPVVTLTTPPPSTVAGSSATASFSTNDATAQAWCSLDGAAAQTCTASVTYSGLSAGGHSISVYAIDPAGNRSPTVSSSFTIVTAAPVFTSVPSGVTLGVATYRWTATPGLTYQYSYDGVHWSTTTTTSSNSSLNLIPGSYTFRLRGVDSLGNHTAVATAATFSVI